MTLKFNRVLAVVEVHVHAKFYLANRPTTHLINCCIGLYINLI